MQLDMDAKSMGYVHIKDSKEFDASERRLCWTKPRCVTYYLVRVRCILESLAINVNKFLLALRGLDD